MELILNVTPRAQTGKAKETRNAGYVPGVVYGQGAEAATLQFEELEFLRVLRAGGVSQLIELRGLEAQPVFALLREVQRHPTRRNVMHVDFYRVQMDHVLRTEVPVHGIGVSPATRSGAVLIHHLERIEIECLPRDIPDAFTVDLSRLQSDEDVIHVRDLAIPPGVKVLSDPDEIVLGLSMPRALEEELAEEAEEALAEPEVIKKGKEVEE